MSREGASMDGGALDWPLSRNEKKSHVLKLYDMDMREANKLLQDGETAMTMLRQELHSLKASAGDTVEAPKERRRQFGSDASVSTCLPRSSTSSSIRLSLSSVESLEELQGEEAADQERKSPKAPPDEANNANHAALRLQQAIAEATRTLGELLGAAALEQEEEDLETSREHSCHCGVVRARSEGANRFQMTEPLTGGLRKTQKKRLSCGGQELRVSFSGDDSIAPMSPEDKKAHALINSDVGGEPEPSPEAPPTPEHLRSDRTGLAPHPADQPRPTWQRNLALIPSTARQRALPCRQLELSSAPQLKTEERRRRVDHHARAPASHGTLLAASSKAERTPRTEAPRTAMDFL
jgi:hypothetical protein